jgi:hypothetical protein
VFDGRNERTASGVQEALGRDPRDLRSVLADAVADRARVPA